MTSLQDPRLPDFLERSGARLCRIHYPFRLENTPAPEPPRGSSTEAGHGFSLGARVLTDLSFQVLLLAGNPGVNGPGFAMNVDVLSATRTDLDIVWRGNCEAPPTAVDGGPPKDLATATQNWSDTPEGDPAS